MKKQGLGRKNALWLLALIALAAAVFLVGCRTAQTAQQPAPDDHTQNIQLYWNVEKYVYSAGDQVRTKRDEYYHVRFAVDGEQVDLKVADQLTVNYIDTMEVMGLVFDEAGVVVDALRVDELGYSIAAEDYYVESFTDDTLVCNSMGNRSGLSKTLPMTGDTKIYMVDETGSVLCGLPGSLQEKSRILAISDPSGNLSHVYTVDPFVMGDVYWNTARKYNSTTKLSTRELDEQGRFVYTFALNGEQVTLYTRDQEVANAIDKVAAKCMGLEFDENGYITNVLATKKVTGGSSFASWCYVLGIDGNIVSAKKYSGSNAGSSYRGTLAQDCKIYDVSGKGAYIGEPTQLRLYDQVHGLKNEYGEICVLFVVSRTYEADIYYNVERKYDSASKTTKRTPAADGYYYIKLARNGQQVTLKTKNKDIVNSIDAAAVRCFGLKVENGEILEFYTASMVWGGRQFCSYDYVTAIDADGTITAEEFDVEQKGQQTYIGKMTEDCGVYNVSSTASVIGEKTTLRVGDKIHALMDLDGNVTHIFVVGRTYNVPIYWNVDRQYDSKNKVTKRTANADGYYEIVLAVGGQQKTYKTKSLELMSEIDAVATKCFGLVTNGDIITKMYKTANVKGGVQFCSWDYVTAIKGNTVVAREADESKGSKTYSQFMTSYTKVYNVSGSGEFIGQETQLQVGDKIHALQYAEGGLNIIYVIERTEQVVEQTAHCQLCEQDVTWYSWDGSAAMENGKHYYLAHNVGISATAYIGAEDNTDVEVTLDLRGHDITAAVRAFRIYGTLNLLDTVGNGTIYGNAAGQATGFYVYDAGTFNMYGGHFVGGSGANSQCGIGALGLKAGSGATFNMYGGSLQKGNTNKDGGNLTLYHSSVFNLYGGTIADGMTATNGGNILMSDQAVMNVYGGSVTGGSAQGNGNCIAGGTVSLYNTAAIVMDDIYMSKALNVPEVLAEGSRIGVTLPSGNGSVTGQTPEANKAYFTAAEGQIAYEDGKLVIKGQADKTAYCEHCRQDAQWYAWDGAFALTTGHYYLKEAVSVTATAYIGSTEDNTVSVCLDLCGNNIDAAVRVFRVYGNLNLMDSAETDGTITGSTNGQASVFYVYENAVFNMYGGTMTNSKAVTSNAGAGIGGIDKGTMNLYGGTITDGKAKKSGGNLNLYNTGVLNVYGGTIANGTSIEASGGNIQMSAGSFLNIYGGTIAGGTAGNLGDCINANGTVTLYEQAPVSISQIRLPNGKTLTVHGTLVENSAVGILMAANTGFFTGETAEENLSRFYSDVYDVKYEEGKLALRETVTEDPNAHRHCVCGGLGNIADHTSCTDVQWTAWPGADQLVLDGSVYYYLTGDVSVDASIKLTQGQTLNLCLNGHSLTTAESIYIFDISGTLNLCDHAEGEGAVTNLNDATGNGAHSRVFYVRGTEIGSRFNLYGGKLSAPNAKATGTGGTVARVGSAAGTSVFNMYGGSIFGGNAAGSAIAGNVVLERGSTTHLYGGTITGGTNTKGAGNVMLKNGASLTVDGGSITAGSGTDGGNVYVKSGCTLTVLSGSITNGDVYAEGTVTVAPGATVENICYPQ